MRIVQLLPSIVPGDAVSHDALAIHRLLQTLDSRTQIYAEHFSSALPAGVVRDARQLPELGEEDVLLYHMSIGTPISQRIDELPCRKVMIYHNITPPAFFEPYSPEFTRACRRGYAELARMRDWFDYAIAVSDFNRRGLLEAGYSCPIDVCPLRISFADYDKTPDAYTMEKYGDGRTNVLFVGRVAPNKCQEDVVAAFAAYQRRYDPTARLILAGGGIASYETRVRDYTRRLGARHVRMTGHIPFSALLALYRRASVFLCMSEHEGFCVPLLEAMHFNVPVVAFDAGAVAETLGGSGLLLREKNPALTAALLERLRTDDALRASLLAGQRRRLADFAPELVEARFLQLFQAFLAAPRPPRRPRVVQMVPEFHRGDAVSQDIHALRDCFRELGCREDVWTYLCDDEDLASSVRCSRTPPELAPGDLAVFHMGMGSDMAKAFAALPCRKALIYHNITPAEYFEEYSEELAAGCRRGLRQTQRLLKDAALVVGDSDYNCATLRELGAAGCAALPVLIPLHSAQGEPDAAMMERYGDGRTNVLFVGRAAPNKKIEDVIRAFVCYRAQYDPTARLLLAGADDILPGYTKRLRAYIARLGGEGISLLGRVSDAELCALYRTASVYLCMSEHEGFCVPLLEAMAFDVPVVARAEAAVPETLGNSGVALASADPEEAAAALHALETDAALRARVLAAQRARLCDFAPEKVRARAKEIFAPLLGRQT